MEKIVRKLLLFALFFLAVSSAAASEPMGLSVQQELSAESMLAAKSPLHYAYAAHAEWREPFRAIDSLQTDRRNSDLLRFKTSLLFSPFYAEAKAAFFISPFAPLELGTFFAAQLFPSSSNRLVSDSLHLTWNEEQLATRAWNSEGLNYLQVAAFVVALHHQFGPLFLELSWTTAALDINSGEGSSIFYYGWDIPTVHGNNLMNWELLGEYSFGTGYREEQLTIGGRIRLTGTSDVTTFFFDPTPSSDEVAQLRTSLWVGVPLKKGWKLTTGVFHSLHSKGGGKGLLNDRLGVTAQLTWHWHHQSFRLDDRPQ